MEYEYLFPFEDVRHNSKVLIYGAGDVGQEYFKQLLITNYAFVIGFIDKNFDRYNTFVAPVYSPNEIDGLEFDFVVLAFKRADYIEEIIDRLTQKGVRRSQIVYKGARNARLEIVTRHRRENAENEVYAYDKAPISIALKYGPGLGDAIIKKALFIELTRMLPDVLIDIYAPGGSKFVSSLYSDQKELNCVIDDGGGQYFENKTKYTLALSVFRLVEVDNVNVQNLESYNPAFAIAIKRHIDNHNKYNLCNFPATQNWIHYGRAKFKGWNCYTIYQYTGVFYILDNKVPIPLDASLKEKMSCYKRLKYITVNFGNGASGKGYKENINKQWPLEYYNEFIYLFKQKYSNVKVIQVGDATTEKLGNVDEHFIDRSIEEVKYVLKYAIFHLDIEGGLVHLATNLGTKCIVLFGPTQVEMYGYPENINIVSDSCSGCYGLYDNAFRCAKGLEKPECMMSITPSLVMKSIASHMIDFYGQ